MLSRGFIFATPLLSLFSFILHAQTQPSDKYIVSIERIPLPNLGRVNAIVRDDLGFLWFGTTNGLGRYDGYEVRVFKNGSGLAPGWMTSAMTKSRDGSLLLATWDGLWTFNTKTERFASFLSSERLGISRIDALAEDSGGTVWIGSRSDGIFKYDRTTQAIRHYTTKEGLNDNRISALLIDHAGVLWIGTRSGGLNSLHPVTSRITHYRYSSSNSASLPSDSVNCLHQSNSNEIWIGTPDGVSILDPKTGDMRRSPVGGADRVKTIAHDPSGRIWIGKETGGLLSYHNGAISSFQPSFENPNTLSDALIRKVYVDPSSNATRVLLWVGTVGGVVNKIVITKNPFSSTTRDENPLLLGRGAILAMAEDRKGIVWVGLWGGGEEVCRLSP
jgi:ligand-binding sensor domain-containing protein